MHVIGMPQCCDINSTKYIYREDFEDMNFTIFVDFTVAYSTKSSFAMMV